MAFRSTTSSGRVRSHHEARPRACGRRWSEPPPEDFDDPNPEHDSSRSFVGRKVVAGIIVVALLVGSAGALVAQRQRIRCPTVDHGRAVVGRRSTGDHDARHHEPANDRPCRSDSRLAATGPDRRNRRSGPAHRRGPSTRMGRAHDRCPARRWRRWPPPRSSRSRSRASSTSPSSRAAVPAASTCRVSVRICSWRSSDRSIVVFDLHQAAADPRR